MLGQLPEPGSAAGRLRDVSEQLSRSPEKPGNLIFQLGGWAGAAGVNGWLNGLWFAVEFRFLSPLLDLARGSIPSLVCDINRSLQPQGCPHLVLAARTAPSAGQGSRGRGVSAQPSRRNQFGRRARLTSGLFETVPPPRARRRAINSGQDALGCGRQQVFQDAAGRVVPGQLLLH